MIFLLRIIDKLLSARFLATILVVWTYCSIVNQSSQSYVTALITTPERLEAFVVGLIMGFSSTATLIIKAYFDRSDRQSKQKEGEIS